jgi:hypothetical protein
MANQTERSPLMGYLTLVVLVLILGCLGLLVYKAFVPPAAPSELSVSAAVSVPLPEGASGSASASGEGVLRSVPGGAGTSAVRVAAANPPRATGPAGEQTIPGSTSEPRAGPTRVPSGPGLAWNGPVVRFQAQPVGSEMRMDGTSSLHDWSCRSTIIIGSFAADAAFQQDLSLKSSAVLGPGKAPVCRVVIPTRTLRSSSGTVMDQIMMEAMKGKEFKTIEYELTEMVIHGDAPAAGSPVTFDCQGNLTVSGKTNLVSFPVRMERAEGGKLKFVGTTKVKMTDFGILPPSPVLGPAQITTGDEVKLTWTWVVGEQKAE